MVKNFVSLIKRLISDLARFTHSTHTDILDDISKSVSLNWNNLTRIEISF